MEHRVLGTVLIRTSRKTGKLFTECQDNFSSHEFQQFLYGADPDYAKAHARYYRDDPDHEIMTEYDSPVGQAVSKGRFAIRNRKGKTSFTFGTTAFNRRPVNREGRLQLGDPNKTETGTRHSADSLIRHFQYNIPIPKEIVDPEDKLQYILDYDRTIYGIVSPTGAVEYFVPRSNSDKPWWHRFIANQVVIAVKGQQWRESER